MSEHILVVDDDPTVRSFVERYLTKQGFKVTGAPDARTMRQHLDGKEVDLLVLDLNLPDQDGLEIARNIRENSDMPIIIVTARGDPIDRIVGLEMGADDYLVKPFEARELLARIKSVLRRATKSAQPAAAAGQEVARFGQWRVDVGARAIVTEAGEPVKLTSAEFDLLAIFVKNPGRVLSRDQLLDMTHGHHDFPFDRSIDVQVLRLRRKIEADPAEPALIKTVRGAGYVFTPKVDWSGFA